MEERKTYQGKTVNEAITNACTSLGVPSTRIEYRVTQQPSNGFLGIGSRPAIIEAWRKKEEKTLQPVSLSADSAKKETSAASEKAKTTPKAALTEEKTDVNQADKKQAENTTAEKEKASAESKEKKESTQTEPKKTDFSGADAQDPNFVSADEIEKRAAAAEKYAPEESGTKTRPERSGYEARRGQRRPRNGDRRDRRNGRAERRDNGRYAETPRKYETAEHKPSVPKPERVVKQRSEEEVSQLKASAEKFLNDVLKAMNVPCEVATSYDAKTGTISCVLSGSEMGLLIGKRGQTLDSLQYLASMAVNKNTDEYVRVKLDTEDYRERREETLRNLARSIAYRVRNTGEPFALEPMNPYERRIIHASLQGNRYVETYSEGEEPHRHVIIAPKRR